MFQWAPPLTQGTSQWDLHHILAWEDRVLAWDPVDQVPDIPAWEDPVQVILGWEAQVLDIPEWVVRVRVILGSVGRVLATLEWEDQVPYPCPQKRFIHPTSPWFSTHRTPMLHQFIPVESATKRFTTTTRRFFVNLAATSGSTECALVW